MSSLTRGQTMICCSLFRWSCKAAAFCHRSMRCLHQALAVIQSRLRHAETSQHAAVSVSGQHEEARVISRADRGDVTLSYCCQRRRHFLCAVSVFVGVLHRNQTARRCVCVCVRALSQSCAALIAWELAVGSSPQLPENDKLTVSKEAG